MPWNTPAKPAKLRLMIQSLIVLVAIMAIGLGIWREYWRRAWRRAIHTPKIERIIETDGLHGFPLNPPQHVFERSIPWPIRGLRIEGLNEAESFEELELAIADPDASIRQEVYTLVAGARASMTRPVAIRLLAPGLGDREEVIRLNAVRSLGPLILPTDPIAPSFLSMLDDRSPLVRQSAVGSTAEVIARVHDSGSQERDRLIAALLAKLDDPEPKVRVATIEAIEFLFQHDPRPVDANRAGMSGKPILTALEVKLDDPIPSIRAIAAYILASHGGGLEAVPMLIDLANHEYNVIKHDSAASGVSWGGRWPMRSLSLLADRSDDAASYLLGRLLSTTNTENPSEPWRSFVEIAGRSPEGRSRIERLAIQRSSIRHPYVQGQLALILHEIGSRHDVLPGLLEAIINPEDSIRRDAIRAIKARFAFDPRILPQVRKATKDSFEYNAMRATEALNELQAASASGKR
jgi:HEAT repeat protein